MQRFSQYLAGFCLGISLTLSALPAHAQAVPRVSVTVPVDFVVGDKQFKAGDYLIESSLDGRALTLCSQDGHVHQIVFTVPIESNKSGNHERLLFERHGDQEFLTQVWLSGDANGHELALGHQNRNVEKSSPVTNRTVVGQ